MVTFEYLYALFRRALPLALFGMLGLGSIALIFSLLSPPTYEATARLRVQPLAQSITVDPDALNRPSALTDESLVDTEVEFLQSDVVAKRLVIDNNLTRDAEFGGGTVEATVAKLMPALKIRRVAVTSLIDISVRSRTPQHAAELANMTSKAYIAVSKDLKREANEAAHKLLAEKVEALADEVRAAEAQVQQFRLANNLLSVNGATLAEQSAANLSDRLASARAEESAALGELAALQGAGPALDQANSESTLALLRAQQATAQQQMSEAASKFGSQHPSYITAAQRLAEVNRAVAAEMARARSSVAARWSARISELKAKARAASQLRQSLEGSMSGNEAGLARNNRTAVQLADLERKAAALRGTYNTYLTRYEQTGTQVGTEQVRVEIISPASPPSQRASPRTVLNVTVGLVAGLLAGLGVTLVSSLLESHFTTGSQIERELGADALPVLPLAKSAGIDEDDNARIISAMRERPTSSFAEMYKTLLSALSRPTVRGANQVILITSAVANEGKTTASVGLAVSAAQLGKRVLLIDADQRRRGVSRALTPDASSGLRNVLLDALPWRSAIDQTAIAGVDILPAIEVSEHEVDIFAGQAFASLLDQVRKSYDLILIDTAPVLPVADTRLIARFADSVMVVCRWRKTSRRAVARTLDALGQSEAFIAGVVLNMVDLRAQVKLGYGEPTFYYEQYKSYHSSPI